VFEFYQRKVDINIYLELYRVAIMQKAASEAATAEEARIMREEDES
jgi:hypothetical protein